MAYVQARSKVCYSGVTYAGWTPPSIKLTIGGVDRTANIVRDENWTITEALNEPATFTFTVKSLTPTNGNDVNLFYATPNDYLFAGTLLRVRAQPTGPGSTYLTYDCSAVGYDWLADRYDLPYGHHRSAGIETIIGKILITFTDGGFRVGSIPSTLGNLDLDLDGTVPVMAVLRQIAQSVNAMIEMSYEKRVTLRTTPIVTRTTLTESAVLKDSLSYASDLTQVRTITVARSLGTTVASAVVPGATQITVADETDFSTSGGIAWVGWQRIQYTGILHGRLTGVTGVTDDILEGATIKPQASAGGGAAGLAAALGGGLSGQATYYQDGGGWLNAAATAAVVVDNTRFSTALPELSFTYRSVQRHLHPGQLLPVSISNPLTISDTFLIQRVVTTLRGVLGSSTVNVFQQVFAARFDPTLPWLLRGVI